MAKGRPPTSDKRKALRGNPGKRPLHTESKIAQPMGAVPKPPKYLNKVGNKWFTQTAKLLHGINLLDEKDLTLLGMAAVQYEIFIGLKAEADQHIKTNYMVPNSKGELIVHPAVKAMRGIAETYKSFAVQIGLTPLERTRLERLINGEAPKEIKKFNRGVDEDLPNPKVVSIHNVKKPRKNG